MSEGRAEGAVAVGAEAGLGKGVWFRSGFSGGYVCLLTEAECAESSQCGQWWSVVSGGQWSVVVSGRWWLKWLGGWCCGGGQ